MNHHEIMGFPKPCGMADDNDAAALLEQSAAFAPGHNVLQQGICGLLDGAIEHRCDAPVEAHAASDILAVGERKDGDATAHA